MDNKKINFIDQMLENNNSCISIEKQQILRAEQMLLFLEKYLAQQNKLKDGEMIIKEEMKNDSIEIHKNSETVVEENLNSETIMPDDQSDTEIPLIISDSSDDSADPISDGLLKPLNIPNINTRTIRHIIVDNGCIICGSNGMMLKHSKKDSTVYIPGSAYDFLYAELVSFWPTNYLIGFTEQKIIVFKYSFQKPFRVIDLPKPFVQGIGNACKTKRTITIGYADGSIAFLCLASWKMLEVNVPRCPKLRYVFPISFRRRIQLLVMEDNRVYKTTKSNLINLECIPDIVNPKGILSYKEKHHILYTDKKVCFLDEECNVFESLVFKFGVKLINNDASFLVVVDRKNTTRVFSLVDTESVESFGSKVLERKCSSEITAVTVAGHKVYLAMDNNVSTIEFTT